MQKDAANGQTDLFGAMGAAAEVPEVEIQPAPTKYSDKEQLMWERDLMGLYISAHPLDKYDTYFEEQTMPINEIKPNLDGANVIVGGIITNVRSLVTKSGSKMAFVKIEDKMSEIEVIVFPKTYEEVGAKLVQDAVVKITGKVNASDRDGNKTDEAKINAEAVDIITDEELEDLLTVQEFDYQLGEDEPEDIPSIFERQPSDYIVEREPQEETDQRALASDLKMHMWQFLDELKPREKKVLILRFGLDGQGEKTLEEVGNELGVSKERV